MITPHGRPVVRLDRVVRPRRIGSPAFGAIDDRLAGRAARTGTAMADDIAAATARALDAPLAPA